MKLYCKRCDKEVNTIIWRYLQLVNDYAVWDDESKQYIHADSTDKGELECVTLCAECDLQLWSSGYDGTEGYDGTDKRYIGSVRSYTLYIVGQEVEVYKGAELVTMQAVRLGIDHFKEFLVNAKDLKLGWAELPDFEVIYIYDRADHNFGYAVNLQDLHLSEWGYAPFV
jgi:hypothetical protein